MKTTSVLVVAAITLLKAVQADFEVYRVGVSCSGICGNAEGWQVYASEANCDNDLDWIWRDSDDVSGGKYGVRCDGDDGGCGRGDDDDAANIDVLEMNFNSDDRHWTYYKDRDGALVDLDGNVVGTCYSFPGPQIDCGQSVGRIEGLRKLRCETDTTAEDINDGRPTKRSMRHIMS